VGSNSDCSLDNEVIWYNRWSMRTFILISQIAVSVILGAMILLQVKGTGFGRVWGGLSASSSRRGLEGIVFKLTFVFAFLFLLLSFVSVVVS